MALVEQPPTVATGLGGVSLPRRVSLPEAIADSVAEAIASRQLAPGDRIVEMSLAGRLNVSRVPIREALKVLHAQGILSGGSHRGYRVAEFGDQTVERVLETRLVVEGFLLRDAIANWRAGLGSPSDLEPALRQLELASVAHDSTYSLRADLDFHRAIRTAARNEIAATLWDTLARHVLIIFSQDVYRDLDAVVRQHRAFRDYIVECVEAPTPRSETELRDALQEHLLQIARRKQKLLGEAEPAKQPQALAAPQAPRARARA